MQPNFSCFLLSYTQRRVRHDKRGFFASYMSLSSDNQSGDQNSSLPKPNGGDFVLPQTILRHFDLISTPYNPDLAAAIHSRRREFPDGYLFLDRLLAMGSVECTSSCSSMPSTTSNRLQSLFYVAELILRLPLPSQHTCRHPQATACYQHCGARPDKARLLLLLPLTGL